LRVLIDTHVYFWWVTDDVQLSAPARSVIAREDNQVIVSAVTAWELATKVRFGKWPEAAEFAANIDRELAADNFTPLAVTLEHARVAGFLPGRHRDPFDRMLAAQAQVEALPLVTADPVFADFSVRVLW
jgi:PIN domain nuclease of toxin-antitoxin system